MHFYVEMSQVGFGQKKKINNSKTNKSLTYIPPNGKGGKSSAQKRPCKKDTVIVAMPTSSTTSECWPPTNMQGSTQHLSDGHTRHILLLKVRSACNFCIKIYPTASTNTLKNIILWKSFLNFSIKPSTQFLHDLFPDDYLGHAATPNIFSDMTARCCSCKACQNVRSLVMESDGENNSTAMTGKISWYVVVVVGTNQAPKNAGKVGLISMLLTMHLIFSGQKSFGNWFVIFRPVKSKIPSYLYNFTKTMHLFILIWPGHSFSGRIAQKILKEMWKIKLVGLLLIPISHSYWVVYMSSLWLRKRIALGGGGNFRFPWLRPLEFRILHTYSCKALLPVDPGSVSRQHKQPVSTSRCSLVKSSPISIAERNRPLPMQVAIRSRCLWPHSVSWNSQWRHQCCWEPVEVGSLSHY